MISLQIPESVLGCPGPGEMTIDRSRRSLYMAYPGRKRGRIRRSVSACGSRCDGKRGGGGTRLDLGDGDLVVPLDHHLGTQLTKVLVEVESERVVIVDHQAQRGFSLRFDVILGNDLFGRGDGVVLRDLFGRDRHFEQSTSCLYRDFLLGFDAV